MGLFKKKKKNDIIFLDDDEKFVIPQIDYGKLGLAKEPKKFVPSEVASPIHGSHVVDKQSFVDNDGKIDVDTNYDFARENKHISDEELIAKHGTKYYEFQIMTEDEVKTLKGASYDGKKTVTISNNTETKRPDFTLITSVDDFLKEENLVSEEPKEEEVNFDDADFDFNIQIEEEPTPVTPVRESFEKPVEDIPDVLTTPEEEEEVTFEFNPIEEEAPKYEEPKYEYKEEPTYSNDSFVEETVEEEYEEVSLSNDEDNEVDPFDPFGDDEEEDDEDDEEAVELENEVSLGDDISYVAPTVEFKGNPAVDRNLTIAEAIERNKTTDYSKYQPSQAPQAKPTPVAKPQPKPEEKPKKVPVEKLNNYKNYHVPYEKIFAKSNGFEDNYCPWIEEKINAINSILASFNIDGKVVNYTKGPAFTRYEIMLAPGVNVKKINQIYDNLQKDLQAQSLRIQAPIPGKNTVGIEVPNNKVEAVNFGDIINYQFLSDGKPLNVAMGKNIDGSPVYQDISEMPHALVAGATKSGKSVSINTMIVSLIVKNTPERLKLILVDPKMVEFISYSDIPHLACPVITDPVIATESLKWACAEMDRRYGLLQANRVKNLEDYNKKRRDNPEGMENLPYIVIIVDEFNDLIMQCGNDANDAIIRLAQKARAAGMHIILATQRPTVNVVNGTIKANITCRIAFRVASDVDSKTILDEVGAESLLGRGDMLIKNNSTPVRAQGAYIPDAEIEQVCEYLTKNYAPEYIFTHEDLRRQMNQSSGGKTDANDNEEDPELLYQVARSCVDSGQCSINSIQTGFGLGFNRASRIVKILEDMEIVSPKNGTKAREILVDSYQLRDIFGVDD